MYTVTYRVLIVWTQHHFVLIPRHWFPSIKCGQPLRKCIDADLGFCACFPKNSGLFLFVRQERVEIAAPGVGLSVKEEDRGRGGEKKLFSSLSPPPPPIPLIRLNLSAFFAVEYGGVDTGIVHSRQKHSRTQRKCLQCRVILRET